MNPPIPLILASSSPRRRALLSLGELPFEVRAADVDESVLPGEAPPDYVSRLAAEKARVVAGTLSAGIVLAADTTVVLDGEIIGKPEDAADARRMLTALRGREHLVYSGLSLVNATTGEALHDRALTRVPMRDYADAEMDAYIASGDPVDKAGAYAIQSESFHPVAQMQGCFANVVGFPLCHLKRNLCKWGLDFAVDLPAACQAYLGYECPVYEEVLAWKQ